MRIAIVTDAWTPQVNGVVNTIKATLACLRSRGYDAQVISPEKMRAIGCPGYPEIRLAIKPYPEVAARLDAFGPEYIHIATEGPLGLAARRYCLRRGLRFTTAYHTRFPEYLQARFRLPFSLTRKIAYRWLRWFHAPAEIVMVPTEHIRMALEEHGWSHAMLWGRGVDITHFHPEALEYPCIDRPLFLYVGRVAVEKNVEAFLRLDLPGTKWVIGDGPQREELEKSHPDVRFLGMRPHEDLPAYYNCADVFVFPSLTDTFGLVLAEAMACGVPVAAFPVPGPIDVVTNGKSGVLHTDLREACLGALALDPAHVRVESLKFSWDVATSQFLHHLMRVRSPADAKEDRYCLSEKYSR